MKVLLSSLSLLLLNAFPSAQSPPKADAARAAISHYNLEKPSLAIQGYDPVAYFEKGGGKPTKGKPNYALKLAGVDYRFANQENLEAFRSDPKRYEPAYGGWCAYAMALGEKVEIDPKSFLIQDDKLLLFYNGFFNDTRKKWSKGKIKENTSKADREWRSISGEGAARNTQHFNLKQGLALQGFDPVSYFSKQKDAPIKGQQPFALMHEDVIYHFSSAANQKAFQAQPKHFEARYGGYCAWAMAKGKKVEVSPTAFSIDEHGLALFFNASKREEWLRGGSAMRMQADKNWAALHAKQ